MRDDGGPAFPHDDINSAGSFHKPHPGMSLRDYIAVHAMNAVLTSRVQSHVTAESAAKLCYTIADAMLKERAR